MDNHSLETIELCLKHLKFKHCVVALSHSDYRIAIGGTEKVMHAERALLEKKGISYIQLFPLRNIMNGWPNPLFQMVGLNIDHQPIGRFTVAQIKWLLEIIQKIGISIEAVHIHHLLGFEVAAAEEILESITAKVRFFLHDFYSVCPQFNLLKNDQYYCGAPPVDSADCAECKWGKQRQRHFSQHLNFLTKRCSAFIAPSEIVKQIWGKSFPHLSEKVQVVPHQIKVSSTYVKPDNRSERIKIAFVGYQQPNKGWNVWKTVVSQLSERSEYEFFHFGACHDKLDRVTHIPVSFVDEGDDAMVKALRRYQIDVAFLWSICPETYSFTLFESLAAGCFIITNPFSGNIAEQIKNSSKGIILKDEEELLRFLNNPQELSNRINNYRSNFYPFELSFNPLVVEEIAKNIENRSDDLPIDSEQRLLDLTKQESYLFENFERETIISREFARYIQELEKQNELIEFLQSKHYEKDVAIENLRIQIEHLSQGAVQDIKRKLDKHQVLKKILKKIYYLMK